MRNSWTPTNASDSTSDNTYTPDPQLNLLESLKNDQSESINDVTISETEELMIAENAETVDDAIAGLVVLEIKKNQSTKTLVVRSQQPQKQ